MTEHSPRWLTQRRAMLVVGLVGAISHGLFALMAGSDDLQPDKHEYVDLQPDEQEYIALGRSLADRGELRLPDGAAAKRMPLFPALLAVLRSTQPADVWLSSAYIVQGLLAWGATMLAARIAGLLAGPRAALLAGVAAGLYGPLLHLQTRLLSETLAIFLLLVAVCVYLCSRGRRQARTEATGFAADAATATSPGGEPEAKSSAGFKSIALVGLVIGLLTLARANALFVLLAFAIVVALEAGPVGRRVARVGLLAFTALLPPALWGWRNSAVVGRFTLSTIGGLNFYLGHNPEYAESPGLDRMDYGAFERLRLEEGLSETAADRELYGRGLAFIRAHPGEDFVNLGRKTKVWLTPTTRSFGPVLAAMALALLAWHAGAAARTAPSAPAARRRFVVVCALLLASLLLTLHALFPDAEGGAAGAILLPIASERDLLLLGIPALVLGRFDVASRRLLRLIVASQWLVAVIFIPLSRLRWAVDPLFVVALAVAVEQLGCRWSCSGRAEERGLA